MRRDWEPPESGQGRAFPLLAAAGLLLVLTFFAHGVVLALAAIIAGPLPAAQTALSLSRKSMKNAVSQVEEPASEATSEPFAESEPAAESTVNNIDGIENYLVALQDDSAKPENAGTVI